MHMYTYVYIYSDMLCLCPSDRLPPPVLPRSPRRQRRRVRRVDSRPPREAPRRRKRRPAGSGWFTGQSPRFGGDGFINLNL